MRKINISWKTRLWNGVCVFKELCLAHFHHWALVDTHAVRSDRPTLCRSGNTGQTVAKNSTDRITSWGLTVCLLLVFQHIKDWGRRIATTVKPCIIKSQNFINKTDKETPLLLSKNITKNLRKVFLLRISARKILEPCLACRSFQQVGMYFKWLPKQNIHLNLEREDLGLRRWIWSWEHLLLFQRTWIQFPIPTCQLTTAYNPSSRGTDALFWPLQVLHTQGEQTQMEVKHPYIH